MTTKELLEQQVREDFAFARGKIILVDNLDGWDREGSPLLLELASPVRCKVLPTTSLDLIRWLPIGEPSFIDPVWLVQPLSSLPEAGDMKTFWVHGQTYDLAGNQQANHDWQFETPWNIQEWQRRLDLFRMTCAAKPEKEE